MNDNEVYNNIVERNRMLFIGIIPTSLTVSPT